MKNKIVTNIEPRYVESDQMGVIHHSNYLIYMEQGRVDWLNALGFSYAKMEQEGVILPVYRIDIKYKRPIKFGQQIKVVTSLKGLPTSRVVFDYQILDENDQICATCDLTLVFTDASTFRPMKPIPSFYDACVKLLQQ